MKKILVIILFCLLLVGCNKKIEKFSLEEEYYNNGSVVEIEVDKFEELMDNKENFGVFIYQDFCAASANFEEVLGEYITEYNMSFYKLSFTNMNETKLKGKVKFYPSFIIFKDGKMVDYLDADSKSDAEYYKSITGFNNWLTNYVVIN